MINNSFTKKIAEALSKNKSGVSFDRRIMHLEREWYTMVGLTVLLLITGALWSVYAYKTYSNVSVDGEISVEEQSVYRAEAVDSALRYIDKRKGEYEKLRGVVSEPAPVIEEEVIESESVVEDSVVEDAEIDNVEVESEVLFESAI
jgi:hypothetical protein